MLTSLLLSHLQTALTAITMTRNVIAPPAKIIATANEVIVGIGTGTGIVGGEKERTATATLTATGSAQTVATATGNVNVAAIAKKVAPAMRKNADETTRAKTTDAGRTPARTRGVPLAGPAAAAAANVTVARQTAAHQRPWVPSRCRSESARPAAGTFMRQATSSTRLCRPSKPVRIVSLLEWDMFRLIVKYSTSGLFNLPGANRTQIPPILAVPGLPPPMPVPTFGMGMAVNPNLSRQSRRLYIGSITPEINETNLADFFNMKMTEMKIGTGAPGNPVLAVQCNYEKSYAFVEVPFYLVLCHPSCAEAP